MRLLEEISEDLHLRSRSSRESVIDALKISLLSNGYSSISVDAHVDADGTFVKFEDESGNAIVAFFTIEVDGPSASMVTDSMGQVLIDLSSFNPPIRTENGKQVLDLSTANLWLNKTALDAILLTAGAVVVEDRSYVVRGRRHTRLPIIKVLDKKRTQDLLILSKVSTLLNWSTTTFKQFMSGDRLFPNARSKAGRLLNRVQHVDAYGYKT